jgi:hypothetical protein
VRQFLHSVARNDGFIAYMLEKSLRQNGESIHFLCHAQGAVVTSHKMIKVSIEAHPAGIVVFRQRL